ncbi:hypothetical protein [Amycolatopsis nigrescens]|uniref:hypothetical protein n=1 Tax=Amycolatopsis nigrescens TaxID=381445 RepID=UPI00037061D4|nr:hypothetical protein [Amycolatopsis nigrescens]
MDLRGLGLRLGAAAAGAGAVVMAVRGVDLPARLAALVLAVLFLGPLVLLLTADVRERLGRVPPEPDPAGRPTVAEWVIAVIFDGACAVFVYVGILETRAGSGLVLFVGLLIGVLALFLTGGTVGRWWRHRAKRH